MRFEFTLPQDDIRVVPTLRVSQSVARRDYIAAFDFEGAMSAINTPDLMPKGLNWSDKIRRPFAYIPQISVDSLDSKRLVRLPAFAAPHGARTATVTIQRWRETASSPSHAVEDMVLETMLIDRPSLILGNYKAHT